MNIAIFTNNYLPNTYGVPMSIETFRRELEKAGHVVYVFAPHWPGYEDKNPCVFRYPSIDTNFRFRLPLASFISRKADKLIKKIDIDIIHAQHPNLLGWTARRWARKKKVPLIFTWHTLYDRYVNYVPLVPQSIVKKLVIRQAVKFANSADSIVVPTDSIIPLLRRWGVKNKYIFSVATGVKEEDFKGADRSKIRNKYSITDREIMLFTASRLAEEKNIEFVFKAFKRIVDAEKENKIKKRVRFMIAGDGYLRDDLENFCKREKISDRVIFCGLVDHNEIKDYLAAADIFLYGSESETQGMTVSEAMYMKLPVVAVKATGISSLVIHNGNGFLTDNNEEDFSAAVLRLIADENLRAKFSRNSFHIAQSSFTASVSAKKILEVYKSALKKI